MDGFHILSRAAIEQELASVARSWSALPSALDDFASWGWVVASVCDTFASENLGACRELIDAETASLSRVIEERQRVVPGAPPPELLRKQAFLVFLGRQVLVAPGVAA